MTLSPWFKAMVRGKKRRQAARRQKTCRRTVFQKIEAFETRALLSGVSAVVEGTSPDAHSHTANVSTNVDTELNNTTGTIDHSAYVVHAMDRGKLLGAGGANPISVSSGTVSLNPDNDFIAGEKVSVSLTQGAMDFNNGTDPDHTYVWQFTAGVHDDGVYPTQQTETGHFTVSTQSGDPDTNSTPHVSALGDLDLDGDLDVLHLNATNSSQEYRPVSAWSNNDGIFTLEQTYTATTPALATTHEYHGLVNVELGDLDGDGDLDAFVTKREFDKNNHDISGVYNFIMFNQYIDDSNDPANDYRDEAKRFTFDYVELTTLAELNSQDVVLADFDNDGDLDVFVANGETREDDVETPQADYIYRNDGSGSFSPWNGTTHQTLVGYITKQAESGDIDGDGDLDLILRSEGFVISSWINNGTGTFTLDTEIATHVSDYELGDLDSDGDLDIFVGERGTASEHNASIFRNDGLGNFVKSGSGLGKIDARTVSLGDLDGDGDLDSYVTLVYEGTATISEVNIWFNDGNGGFLLGAQETFINNSVGAVELGDLDADGDIDAFLSSISAGPVAAGYGQAQAWLNGTRDVELPYQESFQDATASNLTVKAGTWTVIQDDDPIFHADDVLNQQNFSNNVYEADATGLALSVVDLGVAIPDGLDISVNMESDLTAGRWHDMFIIFDYVSNTDFKYAGAFVGQNEWVIGHYTGSWNSNRWAEVEWDEATPARRVHTGESYFVHLRVDDVGNKVILTVDGEEVINEAYPTGFSGISGSGKVGMGLNNAVAQFDNFRVAEYTEISDNPPGLPRHYRHSASVNFGDGPNEVPDLFEVNAYFRDPQPDTAWTNPTETLLGGRVNHFYQGDSSGLAYSVYDAKQHLSHNYELSAIMRGGDTNPESGVTMYKPDGFLIFDYKSETDFKYAGYSTQEEVFMIGHFVGGTSFNNADYRIAEANLGPADDIDTNSYQLVLTYEAGSPTNPMVKLSVRQVVGSTGNPTATEVVSLEGSFSDYGPNAGLPYALSVSSLHKGAVGLGVHGASVDFDLFQINDLQNFDPDHDNEITGGFAAMSMMPSSNPAPLHPAPFDTLQAVNNIPVAVAADEPLTVIEPEEAEPEEDRLTFAAVMPAMKEDAAKTPKTLDDLFAESLSVLLSRI